MASTLTQTGITFPNNSSQVSALPNNTIAFWSGQINTIPTGWQLCDGTNGTPDLRDKFLVGAGSTYSIGNTGGSNTVALTAPQLPAHTHPSPATVNDAGSHSHPHPGSVDGVGNHVHPLAMAQMSGTPLQFPGGGILGPLTITNPGGGSHVHDASSSTAGDHAHPVSVTVTSTGDNSAHENRPPFYALAFIMEVA